MNGRQLSESRRSFLLLALTYVNIARWVSPYCERKILKWREKIAAASSQLNSD
jgi:hypothetical protein